jgi:hypothetical protein
MVQFCANGMKSLKTARGRLQSCKTLEERGAVMTAAARRGAPSLDVSNVNRGKGPIALVNWVRDELAALNFEYPGTSIFILLLLSQSLAIGNEFHSVTLRVDVGKAILRRLSSCTRVICFVLLFLSSAVSWEAFFCGLEEPRSSYSGHITCILWTTTQPLEVSNS